MLSVFKARRNLSGVGEWAVALVVIFALALLPALVEWICEPSNERAHGAAGWGQAWEGDGPSQREAWVQRLRREQRPQDQAEWDRAFQR